MRKIYRVVFLVLLCAVTAGLWTFSQARANDVLETGMSGTCTWTYAMVGGVKTLTIKPTNGSEGTLGALFGWRSGPTSTHQFDTKRVVVEGTVKVGSSAEAMFAEFLQATDMDLRGLDVSEVTDTGGMFHDCIALTTLNGPANWNVAKVKKMGRMFVGCRLTEIDVSNWDVGNVEDMEEMFGGCSVLTSLDVSKWNVSKVTNMGNMFAGCSALTSLDVKNWDVSKVIDMEGMFHICSSLTTLDVSTWKTGNVTRMVSMFSGCKSLTMLDVSKWDVSNVTRMEHMFYDCKALTTLDMSKWDVSALKQEDNMFSGTDRLATIYLGTSADKFVTEKSKRDSIGASVGTAWQQIDASKGGTEDNPKGKIFANADELMAFHSDRTKRGDDREGYVRVAPVNLKINFLKGDPAVQGEMQSQEYKPGETKPLSSNGFTWGDNKFLGWKGSDNKDYADKASYEYHGSYKRVTQPGEVPPETLDLTAQWEEAAVLTFQAKPNGNLNFAEKKVTIRTKGENPSDFLLPSDVTQNLGVSQNVKWTAIQNGNSTSWSYLATGSEKGKLPKEEIEKAAKQGDAFVATTFLAELVDFCKVTLDANLPSGVTPLTKPSALNDITVEKGKEATLPTDLECGPVYEFAGWDTKKDGTGTRYNTGKVTPTADIKLYAQWEKFAHITCVKKEGLNLQFDKESYDTTDSLAFKVTAGVAPGQKVKWTVKEGGNKQNSDWSHLGSELPDAKVREVAVKDNKLVDTTFQVELIDDVPARSVTLTYQTKGTGITLNRTSETVLSGANPLGCSVTSTIPSGKSAKWTVTAGAARPGWSFVGTTLTANEIKGALETGKNLSDMTFQVELVGDGGTDGKGGKPDTGKPRDQKPEDKLKKENTAKASKSKSKKIPGTSDITSLTLLGAQALLPIAGIASIAGIAVVTLRRREKSGQ